MSLEQRQIKINLYQGQRLNQSQLHQDLGWYSREMLGHISFRSNLLTTICVSLRTKHFIQVFFLVHVQCLVRIFVRYRAPEGDCGQVTLC